MKRTEFLFRLAVENKQAYVSETVEVFQILDNTQNPDRPESRSTLLSVSPLRESPKQNLNLESNDKWAENTFIDDIEEPTIKASYEVRSKASPQSKQNNIVARPSNNTELASQENSYQSSATSTTNEQTINLLSVETYSDLNNQMPLAESPKNILPSSSNINVVNIISDVILKPAAEDTFIDDIKEPTIKASYEVRSKVSPQNNQNNIVARPSINTELASQENSYKPSTSSTTNEQAINLISAEKYSDLNNQMPLAESPASSDNNVVNIITDVILKPATSQQYTSYSTYTVPSEHDVYDFTDEECDQMDIETEKDPSKSMVLKSSKYVTLLTPMALQQNLSENSPHSEKFKENTDNFDIFTEYRESEIKQTTLLENKIITQPSTSTQELKNDLPSDTDNEVESSGDEYNPLTDNDISSSDSGSEINIADVQRTDVHDIQEKMIIISMAEKGENNSKDTLQKSTKGLHPGTNKLDLKYPKQTEYSKEEDTATGSKIFLVTNQQYTRKPSARERPTICPICFEDVMTHFPRHLSRHHPNDPDVIRMLNLKPNSKERLELVSLFRKRGNFILKTEKHISHPVRSSRNAETEHFICTYCLGLFNKKLLHRHVKICKSKPSDVTNPGKNCLSKSQTFMASKNYEFIRNSRLKKEVFDIMRADSVSQTAKSDPLICLYGEVLLAKHKRRQIATHISNKIRAMARMLLAIRTMHENVKGLFDVLKPEMFSTFVKAAKIISGYDEHENKFNAPSLPLHMGTDLKIVCNVAHKIVVEKKQIPNIIWENRDEKKSDIKDLKGLLEAHWCNEISSLALKDLKEKQWQKPKFLPLTEDILLFHKHIENISEDAYERLKNGIDVNANFRKLTECVLAGTILFNRKRVGDVQYLKIDTYEKEISSTTQKAFAESLTELEKILCGQFKRVITDGKGSKPVPILFSKRTQNYIKALLNIRRTTNIVPKSNTYLFAYPDSQNKWIKGDYVIRKLAKTCGAKQPLLFTSTRFRKEIATTLQLMNMEADEMEQVATFMGHTKKTHEQFYRLPQDIYQTAKVVKVLLLLERGKGKDIRGKNLDQINLDEDSSDTSDEKYNNTGISKETGKQIEYEIICSMDEDDSKINEERTDSGSEEKKIKGKITKDKTQTKDEGSSSLKPTVGRCRWTSAEKNLVKDYFQNHIKNRITPKFHECHEFLSKYGHKMGKKDWVKVKTFVYNTFRLKK